MVKPYLLEDIKVAIHNFDLINRPYILHYHPDDNEVVQQIVTSVGDRMVLSETPLIKPGQVLLVDRAKVEDYYKEMFGGFVNYQEIGKEDTYGD